MCLERKAGQINCQVHILPQNHKCRSRFAYDLYQSSMRCPNPAGVSITKSRNQQIFLNF